MKTVSLTTHHIEQHARDAGLFHGIEGWKARQVIAAARKQTAHHLRSTINQIEINRHVEAQLQQMRRDADPDSGLYAMTENSLRTLVHWLTPWLIKNLATGVRN